MLAASGLAFGLIRLTGEDSDLQLVVRVIDGDTIELEKRRDRALPADRYP